MKHKYVKTKINYIKIYVGVSPEIIFHLSLKTMKLQHFDKMEEKRPPKIFMQQFYLGSQKPPNKPNSIKKIIFFYLQMYFGTFLFTLE